jgi:hypothetical protein
MCSILLGNGQDMHLHPHSLTPKSKRKTQPKTPKSKKNRRRLHFTPFHSEDGRETPNVAVQSPGPKVKVNTMHMVIQLAVS